MKKYQDFYLKTFIFFVYLNRHVFVMHRRTATEEPTWNGKTSLITRTQLFKASLE